MKKIFIILILTIFVLGIGGGPPPEPRLTLPNFKGALLIKNADQNINHLSDTPVTWQTEVYDIGNFHAPGADSFVIPVGPVTHVRISGSVLWDANPSAGGRFIYTTTNGGFAEKGRAISAIPKIATHVMGQGVHTAVLEVRAGDIIRLHADQDSGITTKILNSPVTWFALEVVK